MLRPLLRSIAIDYSQPQTIYNQFKINSELKTESFRLKDCVRVYILRCWTVRNNHTLLLTEMTPVFFVRWNKVRSNEFEHVFFSLLCFGLTQKMCLESTLLSMIRAQSLYCWNFQFYFYRTSRFSRLCLFSFIFGIVINWDSPQSIGAYLQTRFRVISFESVYRLIWNRKVPYKNTCIHLPSLIWHCWIGVGWFFWQASCIKFE